MNRAFHIGGLVWLGTFLVAALLGMNQILGAVIGAVMLAAMIIKGKLPLWAYAGATAFCACFVSTVLYDAAVLTPARQYEDTTQTLRGVVIDQIDYTTYSEILLKTDRTDVPSGLEDVRIRMVVNAALDADLGDVVKCKMKLTCKDERRSSLYAKNIRFEGSIAGAFVTEETRSEDFDVSLARYRSAISSHITQQLTGDEGAVLAGMLIGRSENILPDIRYNYARAGISHLLSVSGLHLAILVGLIDCVLRNLYLSRRQRSLLIIVVVVAFMGLTGFSQSIVRAGIMMILCVSAGLFGRDSDSLNSLGFALVAILTVNPYAAFSVSLQLSYLATMGIGAFSGPLTDWCSRRFICLPAYQLRESYKWVFMLLQSMSTTVCACLLTAPLVCWSFGQISLVSPLVNLIILPLEPIALGCGLLCGFTGFFPQAQLLNRMLGLPAGIAIKAINQTAAWWSSLPFAAVSVHNEYVIFWMAAVIVIGVMLWAGHSEVAVKRYAASLGMISLLVGAFAHTVLWNGTIAIAVANYGGTVTLAYGKQGAVIGAPDTVYVARNMVTFLQDQEVERISLLVTEKDDEIYGNPVGLLVESFPVETAFGLDKTNGFTAELFGQATVSALGENARYVSVEAGNLRLVKAFEQLALPADVLINQRNEMICAPDVALAINERYFNSRVFALRGRQYEIPVGE
ncbi:ComEC/Rec2 family competence protein [Oscillospiraceae bacterium PP1C4]